MKTILKRITLFLVTLLFLGMSVSSAFAYHYNYVEPDHGYRYTPIYSSGYYYNTYTYGYSGWDYNRVYYRYHYPYSTYRYNSYYPPGTWVAHYGYQIYPMAVGYPFQGYYW
jgi:hypothetical protein